MKSEKTIQKEILNYLEFLCRNRRLYYYRSNSGQFSFTRADGSKGFMKTGRVGCPDITVLLPGGRFVGVEVKTKKGSLSPFQKKTAELIEELGGVYLLVRSVEELKENLESLVSV